MSKAGNALQGQCLSRRDKRFPPEERSLEKSMIAGASLGGHGGAEVALGSE